MNEPLFGGGGDQHLVEAIASSGRADAVDFLFSHGAHFADKGGTALLNVARQQSPADIILDTTSFGIWPNALGWKNSSQMAIAYIRHGADVNDRGSRNFTPLAGACENGNADLVRTLLRAGASQKVLITDEFSPEMKRTPRELALRNKTNQWREVIKLLDSANAK